jgi:DNA-binding MarR family transcriptional regulator
MFPDPDGQISAVRAFNRFYTRKLGVLDQQLLKSPFSLSEARVLYELATCEGAFAKEIGIELGLDPGYLSRIVQKFDEDGLITRKSSPADRRQYQLSLTAKGRQAFAKLDRSSQDEVAGMLAALSNDERKRLIGAMAAIEQLLGTPGLSPAAAILREPRPGDMGWVVQSHGALYAGEYGFDASFEALVAEIAAKFLGSFDGSPNAMAPRSVRFFSSGTATTSPNCDCCWSIRPHADSDWDSAWSRNASGLRGPAAIARSRCGPKAFWSPPARSIRTPDSCWSPVNRTAVSAKT